MALSEAQKKLLHDVLKKKGIASSQTASAIPKRPEPAAPLTIGQEGLWFLDRLHPDSAHYSIPAAIRMRGPLDRAALEGAIAAVLERHEALRMRFRVGADGEPEQIPSETPFELPLEDLAGRDAQRRARAYLEAEALRPFDLERGPVFRAVLLRLGESDHVLCLNLHHIVADGWSMGILARELREQYLGRSGGHLPSPPPPVRFGDFAAWERRELTGDRAETLLRFWRDHLAGSRPLRLPLDRPRPAAGTFEGAHLGFTLEARLASELRELARRENLTLFVVLQTAFRILLQRVAGQTDTLVGSTLANRERRELQDAIGYFVNTMPLRVELKPELKLRQALERVRDVMLACAANQALPFQRLVTDLKPKREPGSHPLFQVLFDVLTPDHNPAVFGYGLDSPIAETLAVGPLTWSPFEFENGVSRFDLAFFFWVLPDTIAAAAEYAVALFDESAIRSLFAELELVLREMVAGGLDASVASVLGRLGGVRPLPVEGSSNFRLGIETTSGARPGIRTARQKLSHDATAALLALARDRGVGIEHTLLGAWRVLLDRLQAPPDAVLGLAFHSDLQLHPFQLPLHPEMTRGELIEEAARAAGQAAARPPAGSDAPLFSFALEPGTPGWERSPRALRLGVAWRTEGGRVAIDWTYDAGCFEEQDVDACQERLAALCSSLSADPEASVASLSAIGPQERERLLAMGSGAQLSGPDACIHELIQATSERTPDSTAVVFRDERLSYGELVRRAERVAAGLAELGAGPDVKVGLSVERSLELVVGILGILKAGAAYVPLDPRYPADRLGFMLEDSGAALLLTRSGLVPSLPRGVRTVTFEELEGAPPSASPIHRATPDHLAYVIYTSGSTGKPKGVPISHRNLVSSTRARPAYYGAPVRCYLLLSSFAFDSSVAGIFWTLCDGGTLCLPEQGQEQDVLALGELIERHGVSHLLCLPSLWNVLLSELPESRIRSLTDVIVAGEACAPTLTREHFSRLPRARLHNEYGPTEGTVWATAHTMLEPEPSAQVPIGRPVAGSRAYVLDASLQPVPVGCPGELLIGGAGIAAGYLNRPELTAERFVSSPFEGEAGTRLYRTGDLVRFRWDGCLEFLGRADDQIKIRGFRIELGEIESALCAHPAVDEAVVLAREAGGQKRLAGYVTCARSESPPTPTELRQLLGRTLPEYMVPPTLTVLEAFPRMPNGKVDRTALPDPEAAAGEQRDCTPPRNEVERTLAEIWLGILPVSELGVHDNFFELGGDSILSIRIVAEAQRRGLRVTPMDLFKHQTIAELAPQARPLGFASQEEGPIQGEVPLTPVQHWWLEQDLTDSHHWNMSVLLETSRTLDLDVLERAAREVVAHHDAFRLRLRRSEDGWRQELVETEPLALEQIDLSSVSAEQRDAHVGAHADRIQAGLDPVRGPIARIAAFDLGTGKRRLLIVVHHIAIDGVSWRILLEDLERAYAGVRDGEGLQLPPKTASFKRWAERLHERAAEAELVAQADGWRGVATGSPAPLPRDRQGGPNAVGSTRTHSVSLSEEETRSLLRTVPEAYRTQANDALLSSLLDAYWRWTGREEMLITLEGHGREDEEGELDVSRTVGWFTSLYPALLRRRASDDPGDRLKAVKEQLRAIPDRGLGYGLLRYLGRDETLRRELRDAPQAEIGFNYLGQFDSEQASEKPFRLLDHTAGREQSPAAERRELIEVIGIVIGGRLRLDWVYSENLHSSSTIEALARDMLGALRALVEHCRKPGSWGYTPSDFPEAQLRQDQLDRLVAELDAGPVPARGNLEAIYPLTPVQEATMLHSLRAQGSEHGFLQLRGRLRGRLRVDAFQRAWDRLFERHAALRSTAHWRGLAKPLQVVRRRVELPWQLEDWRDRPLAEQESDLDALLAADRRRGFDLGAPPLTRFILIRLGEREHYFVWSCHHLFQDGWAGSLAFREILTCYEAAVRGEEPSLDPAGSYREYVRWLKAREATGDEEFWTNHLKGVTGPTPFGLAPAAASGEGRHVERSVALDPELAARLQSFSRSERVTLSTLVQGALAIVMSACAGRDEVVFGNTFSGRPPELDGSDTTIGLFTNALPVHIGIPRDIGIPEWLRGVQQATLEVRAREQTPLSRIQSWLGVSQPLFETLLVFENYAWGGGSGDSPESVRIESFRGAVASSAAVTLAVSPEPRFTLTLIHDTSRLRAEVAERILEQLQVALQAMPAEPALPPLDLRERLGPATAGSVASPSVPARTVPEADDDLVPPETPTEREIAQVFSTLLQLEAIGVYDNFFDMGGTSLLSLQAVEQLEERLGIEVNPGELVYQTLGQLAATLDERRTSQPEPQAKPGGWSLARSLRRVFRD